MQNPKVFESAIIMPASGRLVNEVRQEAQILNAENNHRRELTEAERGRGIQTMLSLGVPVSDAAATAGTPASWPS